MLYRPDTCMGSLASSEYGASECTRRELYARASNLFNREWEEDATSDATIDLDSAPPRIVVEDSVPVMYYGSTRIYEIALVSALRTDDRMFTCRGDIFPNEDVIAIYAEIARVIDDKIVAFRGTYGCASAFTGRGDAECTADDVVPYYFTRNSPLRGTVDFNELLPAGETAQRRVIIVNVMKYGPRLANSNEIPDRSVIYLAGAHDKMEHARFRKRFSGCDKCPHCVHKS